jgi:hypothetical protein
MKKHILLFIVASSASAFADAKEQAKEHIDKATTFHGEGKFKDALDALTVAYTLDPRPELLYAIAQMHVQLGNCPQAITFYERFLTSKPRPAPGPAAAAKEAIETCKAQPPPVEVKTEPPPVEPPPAPAVEKPLPPPQHDGGKPWYKDVIGDALVISGVGFTIASIVFFRGMSGKLDDADNAATYPEVDDLRDEAAGKRNLGIGFAVGGLALIGAGVARYMLRDTGERSAKVVVAPADGGGVVTLGGRF